MKKRHSPIAIFICALFLLGISAAVAAQSLPAAWRTYDKFDGLRGSWFFDIVQTPDGTLWFGADQGVSRFNGIWQAFGSEEGLPAGAVRALLAFDGKLWAGATAGVVAWQGEQWAPVGENAGAAIGPIYSLARLPDGAIWAGGEMGLFAWDPQTQTWSRPAGAPPVRVWQLWVGEDGSVWLASGVRLFRYQQGAWREIPLLQSGKTLQQAITVMAGDGEGGLWVGTEGAGLAHLQGKRLTWIHEADGLPQENVTALLQDPTGTLYVGTNGGGVGILREGAWSNLTLADGLAADFVTAIFKDRDGIFWFGTVAGVSRFDPQRWRTWRDQKSAPATLVSTLITDEEGILWAGTYGDGLFIFDGETWHAQTLKRKRKRLPTDFVESSFLDAQGNLWLGLNGAGVLRIGDDQIEHFTTDDGLAGNIISAITQGPDGALWFAAFGEGVSRWNGETWEHFSTDDGLASNEVQALLADRQGRVWAGTRAGLSLYAEGRWRSHNDDRALPAREITALAQGKDGSLWVATWGGGVSRFDGREWTHYDTNDGLLAPGVDAIWADPASDRVWFGTVSGLSVFDGLSWQNFGAANGAEIGRIYALAPAPDGGLYLGTDRGVVRFKPDHTPPQVRVVAVNGQAPIQDAMHVSPLERLQITLVGSDLLTDQSELFYLYRLAGYNETWQGTRTPIITYDPLPQGVFTFEVKARDTSLNYSAPVQLQLDVSQEPPTILLPLLGEVRTEYTLAGVAVLTLFVVLLGYAVWSTLARLALRRQAMERRFNPYVAGAPIHEPSMFYGRQALLNEIDAAIYHNSLMIHGERRIGKTSLLLRVKERLEQKKDTQYHFVPVFIDLEGAPENEFFHRLMEGVAETSLVGLERMAGWSELRYFQVEPGEEYSDRDFRRDLRQVIDFLNSEDPRQLRLIFLIDEADVLNTYSGLTQQQFRRILQDTFAQYVRAIVAGVQISKAWERVESPWFNMFVDIAIEPFDRHDSEKLIREPVAGFYEWDEAAVLYVWAQSQGRPHRIQQICLEAINIMLDDQRRRVTIADAKRANQRVLHAEMT